MNKQYEVNVISQDGENFVVVIGEKFNVSKPNLEAHMAKLRDDCSKHAEAQLSINAELVKMERIMCAICTPVNVQNVNPDE